MNDKGILDIEKKLEKDLNYCSFIFVIFLAWFFIQIVYILLIIINFINFFWKVFVFNIKIENWLFESRNSGIYLKYYRFLDWISSKVILSY